MLEGNVRLSLNGCGELNVRFPYLVQSGIVVVLFLLFVLLIPSVVLILHAVVHVHDADKVFDLYCQ